jgi:hypothetical protein
LGVRALTARKEVPVSFVRKFVHFGLPVLGLLVAVAGAVAAADVSLRVALVVVGLLLIHAATWKLPYRVVRNERRFRQLRNELDEFVWLVRELNAAAVEARRDPAAEDRFEDLHTAMQESLERMAMYAGRTDEELLRDQPELQPR